MNIEESKNQIETLIEAWQLDEADLNQTDINAMQVLLKENQELKKQLEEKQNPLKGIFAQVNDDTLLRDCGNMNAEINKLKNQQKEFTEYLEEEMKSWTEALNEEHDYELVQEFSFKCNTYEEILSKFKEITGGKDDKR